MEIKLNLTFLKALPDYLVQRYYGWKATTFANSKSWYHKLAEDGQHPRAMIISCCDSRVHVTSIFGSDAGEFFIHRNIANLVPLYSPDGENIGEYNLRNPSGVGFRAGYKLKRSPDVYLSKMRYGHILKGAYFKPEIIVSIYNEDVPTFAKPPSQSGYDIARRNATSGALMMNLGKQWIFSDQFSLDIYLIFYIKM